MARLRAALPWLVLGLLGAWIAVLLVPLDLNLTDGGFLLAQSDRLLDGEIPHVDFLSPRPAGSAVVHLVDFALPLPLFLASRLVSIAEVVAYSALLGLLVFDRPLRGVSVAGLAGICAAALVNFQVFPPFAWHTIDGLLFSAAGLLAIERGLRSGRAGLVLGGAAAAGAAVVMKQSFFLVPVVALGRLAFSTIRAPERSLRDLVAPAAAMAAPGLLYLGVITAAGGLDQLWEQVAGADAVYGRGLFDVLVDDPGRTLIVLAAAALLLALIHARPLAARGRWHVALDAGARAGLTALVLVVALGDRFALGDAWAIRVFWLAVLTLIACSWRRRSVDYPGLVVVALGWMAALSYGVPTPAFAAGSLALYVIARAWDGFESPAGARRMAPNALTAGALACAAITAFVFWDVRSTAVYLQARDESVLTAELDSVAPALNGIRADPATAAYLRDVKGCVDRYPARWTAVIPEDAVSRLAFDLESPFPLDWLWPPEYRGDGRQRLVDAARALDRRDDWLVLFQTVPAGTIQGAVPPDLPQAKPGQEPPPFPFDPSLARQIRRPLHGERVACGSLVGVYRPASFSG